MSSNNLKRSRWDDNESDNEEKLKQKKKKNQSSSNKKSGDKGKVDKDKVQENETTRSVIRAATRDSSKSARPCRSIESYQRLNFIDQGTYGMVFRAKCKETGEMYALKQVKFGNEVNKIGFPYTALREINILLSLKHPNIVNVREVVVEPGTDKVFMVMEFCENDLKTCMTQNKQSFSIAEIKQLMIQLLSAVEYMHQKWYIHRDLKSANLLYSNKGMLKVCDFGLARKYDSPLIPYTFEVVTLWYRAPELLLGSKLYSTPIDMWSVGCIFAEMLLGEPIFPGQGEPDQISKIFKVLGSPNEDRWPGFSSLPNASRVNWRLPSKNKLRELFPMTGFLGHLPLSDTGLDLLSDLLNMDPKQRASATSALSHPWLTSESPYPTPAEFMPTFRERHEEA